MSSAAAEIAGGRDGLRYLDRLVAAARDEAGDRGSFETLAGVLEGEA